MRSAPWVPLHLRECNLDAFVEHGEHGVAVHRRVGLDADQDARQDDTEDDEQAQARRDGVQLFRATKEEGG